MNHSILKYSFINSILTAIYIVLVGSFFHALPTIFGKADPSFLIPICMLLLFVFSAALCGSLVLGRPILWYLDGKKKEAVHLFAATLGWMFGYAVIAFILLYVITVHS